jgi:sacsin
MINQAVKAALADPDYAFDHSFEVKIKCGSSQESNETCFVVHHTIRGDSMDSQMRQWKADQSLVPWVAVAAQYPVSTSLRKLTYDQV